MIVTLKRELAGSDVSHPSSLRPGVEYPVLEVYAEMNGDNFFRVESGSGNPAMFGSRFFEVQSRRMPECWILRIIEPGSVLIQPAAWSRQGFWESFFDGEQNARDLYVRWREEVILGS
ncbi:hypothetical protein [Streptomyces zingiberis]|uniref:Uncharacterized protein n=1 Tax=Streptomyces zingiberis TaxID=2053010 RepID=A0ABX1BXQ8_9ACTN|nr:hypothetical protein [Streptomyces zingiberis]NJQ02477.1 hypothetical protein [Streptomyces zingiberis]